MLLSNFINFISSAHSVRRWGRTLFLRSQICICLLSVLEFLVVFIARWLFSHFVLFKFDFDILHFDLVFIFCIIWVFLFLMATFLVKSEDND